MTWDELRDESCTEGDPAALCANWIHGCNGVAADTASNPNRLNLCDECRVTGAQQRRRRMMPGDQVSADTRGREYATPRENEAERTISRRVRRIGRGGMLNNGLRRARDQVFDRQPDMLRARNSRGDRLCGMRRQAVARLTDRLDGDGRGSTRAACGAVQRCGVDVRRARASRAPRGAGPLDVAHAETAVVKVSATGAIKPSRRPTAQFRAESRRKQCEYEGT